MAVAIVVLLLIGTRAALPPLVERYVNDKLQGLEAYDGRVADVDLALWRGAYRVEDIRIVKTGAAQPTPFFSARSVDFSIEWPSLFRGSLVARGVFWQPDLNLVQAKNEQQSQTGKEVNWADRLEEFFPFRFNTVRVRDGTITFRAPGIRSTDALEASRVNGEITNLTNVADSGKETFAGYRASASVLDDGEASLSGSVDPLARQPTFDVNLVVKNVELPKVNPWLRQYIKADAESGEFELFMELAAADGKFEGYAKPMMRDVNILSSEEPEENPLRRLWEGIVEFATNVLESQETDRVAARIPFRGTIKDPEAGILETIVSVLRNAFVSAFARSLEGSISVRDVKQNLREYGEDSKQARSEDKKKESEEPEEPSHGPKRKL